MDLDLGRTADRGLDLKTDVALSGPILGLVFRF